MPNKQQNQYLFDELVKLIPRFCPETFLTDFEIAAQIAFTGVYPNSEIKGCFFY